MNDEGSFFQNAPCFLLELNLSSVVDCHLSGSKFGTLPGESGPLVLEHGGGVMKFLNHDNAKNEWKWSDKKIESAYLVLH